MAPPQLLLIQTVAQVEGGAPIGGSVAEAEVTAVTRQAAQALLALQCVAPVVEVFLLRIHPDHGQGSLGGGGGVVGAIPHVGLGWQRGTGHMTRGFLDLHRGLVSEALLDGHGGELEDVALGVAAFVRVVASQTGGLQLGQWEDVALGVATFVEVVVFQARGLELGQVDVGAAQVLLEGGHTDAGVVVGLQVEGGDVAHLATRSVEKGR